jgi:hypothetical protein
MTLRTALHIAMGLELDERARLIKALLAADPELAHAMGMRVDVTASPLVNGDGTGTERGARGTKGDASPIAELTDRSGSSSEDLNDSNQSLSLLQTGRACDRGREGDESGRDRRATGDASPGVPVAGTHPPWERETRDLLEVRSEGEWAALRLSIRREVTAAVQLRRAHLPMPSHVDLDRLETAVVAAALSKARTKMENGAVDAPLAYFPVVVRNTALSVLRDRATRAARKKREREEEAKRRHADAALEREALSPETIRQSLRELKNVPRKAHA